MKNTPKLLLALLMICVQPVVAQSVAFTLPETGKTVRITFKPGEDSDTFRSFRIHSGGNALRFVVKNPVVRIPADPKERQNQGLWVNIPGLKLSPDRYFLEGTYGNVSEPHTLLFFLSHGFASGAAPLLVIGFRPGGIPFRVLEREEFDVTAFRPTSDGSALIIGKESLSQVMNGDIDDPEKEPYATTYDPFGVFCVEVGHPAVYSLSKSRKYNRRHYVWAGPHSREDFAVFYGLAKHPRLFGAPASQLDALLGEGKRP